MNRIFIILACLVISALQAYPNHAMQILDKAASKVEGNGALSCSFTLHGTTRQASGLYKSSGSKFALDVSGMRTWYDGKNMWTLNPSTKEVTLFVPTAEELAEVNPLSYLHSYSRGYRVLFSKRKDNARHLILLNPVKANSPVKAVEIAVNKKTLLPERITIRNRNDIVTTVEIKSLKLGVNVQKDSFTYSPAAFPGYELVDLR